MAHYSAFDVHNSAFYYRHDLMEWRRRLLAIPMTEIARQTGMRVATVSFVFKGKASDKKAYLVAKVLGLDWAQVHNLELKESEFHLAIQNGKESHSPGEEEAGLLVAEPASLL